jgi:pyrimidine operon attenuation protein/uracil phosphoribosyltransferase
MNTPPPATELLQKLADLMRPHVTPDTVLVGIHTGGVWIAEWLHGALGLKSPLGSIDVSYYRDDHHLGNHLRAGGRASSMPFDVEGAHLVIVDDVLHTGRTTRAALNELFDYGRPARVDLAVLVDRDGRELPIAPTFCAHALALPESQSLNLAKEADGSLVFKVADR